MSCVVILIKARSWSTVTGIARHSIISRHDLLSDLLSGAAAAVTFMLAISACKIINNEMPLVEIGLKRNAAPAATSLGFPVRIGAAMLFSIS